MTRRFLAALTIAATLPLTATPVSLAQAEPDQRAELQRQLERLEAQQAEIRDRLAELGEADADAARAPANPRAPFQRFRDRAAQPGDFLGEIDPEMRERFERFRRENPERAERFIEKHRERLRDLRDLRETDPEAFERRVEFMRSMREAGFLASQIAVLEDAGNLRDARERRDELRALIARLVDMRLEHQRRKTQEIEARLEEARESIAQMEASRDDLVDEHLEKAIDRAHARLQSARGAEPDAP
jgi:septal ring factor EnvC (AmiA/AmiB activator)